MHELETCHVAAFMTAAGAERETDNHRTWSLVIISSGNSEHWAVSRSSSGKIPDPAWLGRIIITRVESQADTGRYKPLSDEDDEAYKIFCYCVMWLA